MHPQHWPEDLDYQGKKIVVIGSGATAVTLIPALIDSGAGHVTMLQRSPTYIAGMPDKDPFAARAHEAAAGEGGVCGDPLEGHRSQSTVQYQIARRFPNFFKQRIAEDG